MSVKNKYPKSFYDDGLGEILEWIDDEVLVHSENKIERSGKISSTNDVKTVKKKKPQLYGDNELSEKKDSISKRIKFSLDDSELEKVDKALENRVRGLVNRLTAQTMPFVTSEFEKLYSYNSRSLINAAIFGSIETSIISRHSLTKRKLIAELMLLVSYLSYKVSQDIGASLIHRLVVSFEKIYAVNEKDDEDKRLENIVLCLVNLYLIGLVSSHFIFEVTSRICSDFTTKSLELLTIIMKSVGFRLRKDNPVSMRQLIIAAQEQSTLLKSNSDVGSRIEFMMEALAAIKNNNMSKLINYGCDVDKDTIESTLKILIKRSSLAEYLVDASYEEILNSPNWYLLETRLDGDETLDKEKSAIVKSQSIKSNDKICKALGLNKPSERTIFTSLLRASDYIEASNIVIGIGLNYCSDVMIVAIHVAIHEKKYNQFYYNLINNLSKFNRKYKMAAKFAIQDKIRALSRLKIEQVDKFKRLCFELIKSDAVPITILKAVEWANLSPSTKEYLIYLLESISDLPELENRRIMLKVDRKSSFAGAMRTFTNCFLKGCKLFH